MLGLGFYEVLLELPKWYRVCFTGFVSFHSVLACFDFVFTRVYRVFVTGFLLGLTWFLSAWTWVLRGLTYYRNFTGF